MSELSKALALIGLLAPFGAGALGIGDIRSHSSLNQPLSAEIPLVLSGGDKLSHVEIRLASPEAFAKAGVERLHALTQLQFQPVTTPDGRYLIQVSSTGVIQETFLDFLVEVESPQGTVLREFTLLLDPSGGLSKSSSSTGESASYDEPPPSSQGWDRVIYPASDRFDQRNQSPRYSPEPETRDPAPAISRAPIELTGETYGPVRRRERLIDIAGRIDRPGSVTRGQMAAGLYLANPRAFNRSMNSLRAGSILRVPTEAFLSQIDPAQAGAAPEALSHKPRSLESEIPTEMIAGSPMARTGSVSAVADVSSRVPTALKKENEELREQLSQMEQRLEEVQRMLTLKNAELATLLSHEEEAIAPATQEVSQPAEPTPQTTSPPTDTRQPPQTAALPVAEGTIKPTAPAQDSPPSQISKAPPVSPSTTQSAESPPTEAFMSPGFWLASSALTLLGLAAWLYRRQRKGDESGNEQIDTLDINQSTPISPAAIPINAAKLSAAGELPASSITATDLLDPLWETDVYLHYGRYAQAEALMRETIKNEPDRDDLKQKLFEVLHFANKSDALGEYLFELQSEIPDLEAPFWAPIQSLRPELFLTPARIDPPPEIIRSETLTAPIAEAIRFSKKTATVEPTAEALDPDDTDFTSELLALEEQSKEAAISQPNSDQSHPLDSAKSIGIKTDPGLNLNDEADISSGAMGISSPEIDELISGLTSSTRIEEATRSQDENVLDDLTDIHFNEELQALAAQYPEEKPEPSSDHPAEMALTQEIDAAAEANGQESTPEEYSLIAFDTSGLSLLFDPDSDSTTSVDLKLDNLIPFDTSDLDAALAPLSLRPDQAESAQGISASYMNDIRLDLFLADAKSPASASSRIQFGTLDFELDLIDPADTTTLNGDRAKILDDANGETRNEAADFETKLAQARMLIEQNEKSAARALLQEVQRAGSSDQKADAKNLLNEIAKVHLTLVTPASRKVS